MRFSATAIAGVVIVEPDVHRDPRGFFLETFHAAKYAEAGLPAGFVQDNHSSSVRHTLRGLHMQLRKPQGKLVRVTEGEIWDVAVDLRPNSPLAIPCPVAEPVLSGRDRANRTLHDVLGRAV
jgi:dTDP-4-dehydrorhamnose 3,5-epimerase